MGYTTKFSVPIIRRQVPAPSLMHQLAALSDVREQEGTLPGVPMATLSVNFATVPNPVGSDATRVHQLEAQ
jgi:hypothetical protein